MRLSVSISLIIAFTSIQSCANNSKASIHAETQEIGNSVETNPKIQSWQTVDDSLYSMECPANWQVTHTGQKGLSMIAVSPKESQQDSFREKVSLIIQEVNSDMMNPENFVKQYAPQIQAGLADSKIVAENGGNSGDTAYKELHYTGNQSGFELMYVQRFYIHHGNAYILSFTCEKSKFDSYKAVGFKVLNSLKFK